MTCITKQETMLLKIFDDYCSMVSEAKHEATKGIGLKILTPKQMLQRLPIALPQVKASNNSESLLNEIRKIVYSLYQSKEITKKVYNNIINLRRGEKSIALSNLSMEKHKKLIQQ